MHAVTEKDHAELGPSGWDRWSVCPGSVALSRGRPNTTSQYAAEGTVAHEVADRVLSEQIAEADELLDATFEVDGFTFEVDEEMVDAVDLYIATVREIAGEDGIVMPEQSVPIGHLTGETGATGTSDAIVINGKRLSVIDFKYGKGVRVNAEANGQGRMYALGALHKFAMIFEDIEEVEIVIVQARLEGGVTSEVLSIGEIEEFKDEVELAAATVELASSQMGDYPVEGLELLVPGEKQCKFCRAAAICPKLQAEISSSMALVSSCSADDFADLTIPKQAASMAVQPGVTNEKLAEFMRAVPLMEDGIKAVRAEVERRLFEGQEVPGFYLGVGRKGHRKWADEDEARKALVKRGRLTKAQAFEEKLISPAKAEKLLSKDTIKLLQKDGIIVQPDGKPSVCMVGDKNPPYQISTADDFADLSSAQGEAERLLS
jgi:hypothetical protein